MGRALTGDVIKAFVEGLPENLARPGRANAR